MKNISPSSLAALFFCLVPFAYANPLGGVVAGGDVNAIINGQGTALTTISQSSDTAIINWNSFNIDGQESTVFQFNGAAGANSAVLNLVNAEAGSSTIAGLLQSTVGANGSIGGTVMILNPAGILFTPTAQVNVGSLVATTLGLADQNEFLNRSTLHFSGDSTAGVTIQNQANINALGDIFLIAHTVQNSGTLTAGNEVGLAAGTTVTLMQSGMERLAVVAGMTTQEQPPVGVNNTEGGQINAVITELKAAGGNIYALAINNGGVVRATGLVNENGRIFFRAIDSSTGRKGVVSSTGTINRTLNIDGPNAPLDVIIEGSQVTLGGTVAISPGTLTVTTASGTGLNDTGDIHINDNTGIMADSVSLHSGVNGTGDISFGSGVTVSADEQFYQAGIGDGTANTAVADLTGNSPAFSGSGNSSPEYFVFQQDATIADANIPAASQFLLNTPPHFYQILSEGGNLTLSSGAKVMGSDLALFAWGTLTIADSLTLNSLYAASADHIVLTGGANSEITTTAGQIYYDGVTLGANMTLNGTAIDFNDTITGAGKNLTLNNSGTATLEGAVSGVDRFFRQRQRESGREQHGFGGFGHRQ
ncbi:MAG: filamentous hemagglutinin N-terminal domain-containing protein [Limisphaerales bacterium]